MTSDQDQWSNWAGNQSATPRTVLAPDSDEEILDQVERALAQRTTVKMIGTGHSFSAISAPVATMLRPDNLTGIVGVDRDEMTARVRAGTPLHVLNSELARLGLSLHNMGDIEEQTIAGAVSTGTHGAGGRVASLGAQIASLTMITGTGERLTASPTSAPEVFAAARVGLGALGIITEITLRVEPLFALRAHERPMSWAEFLASYDDLDRAHDHLDCYWFPHTEHVSVKTNDRLPGLDDLAPLPRWREYLEDDFLANTVFGAMTSLVTHAPRTAPAINRIAGRALSERYYSDVAHRVFTTPRRVRFREMEFAVPRDAGLDLLREVRRVIDTSRWRIGFPIEIRSTPADDITLSMSTGRPSLFVAFHVPAKVDHTDYFGGMEDIVRGFGGRPHWGKIHTHAADELAGLYPGFGDFLALRDRLDPHRIFTNPYLQRVLGE